MACLPNEGIYVKQWERLREHLCQRVRERFTKDTIGKKDEINRNGPYLISLNSRNKPILPDV